MSQRSLTSSVIGICGTDRKSIRWSSPLQRQVYKLGTDLKKELYFEKFSSGIAHKEWLSVLGQFFGSQKYINNQLTFLKNGNYAINIIYD